MPWLMQPPFWRTVPQQSLWSVLTGDPGIATRRSCGCHRDPLVFGHDCQAVP